MIYLRTGLPGASKTLNSLKELVESHDENRPYYYNNVKLLMLDMDVARSFSGWFYGWYFPNLKDRAQKRKLEKIMKPIHDQGEFISVTDVPWLEVLFESHDHFTTWLYWVRRVYPKKKLLKLEQVLDAAGQTEVDKFEMVKHLNLNFNHFDDPRTWSSLPKRSVIFIDEAQQFFPPRPVGSKKPQAIGDLETHRHGGYDIHFVTQDRTLVDANMRKLVGCHVHFFNPLGGKGVKRKEAPKCIDPDDFHQSKIAKTKPIKRDSNFYGVYWSAEIHTHKFKFPPILFFGLLCVLLLVYSVSNFYSMFFGDKAIAQEVQVSEVQQSDQVNKSAQASQVSPLQGFLDETLTDVYINGSMTLYNQAQAVDIDYAFYRSSDEAVFEPEAFGLVVQPIGRCLANLVLDDVVRPVTCNPFYKREVVEEREDRDQQYAALDTSGTETSVSESVPDISVF